MGKPIKVKCFDDKICPKLPCFNVILYENNFICKTRHLEGCPIKPTCTKCGTAQNPATIKSNTCPYCKSRLSTQRKNNEQS